MEQEQPIKILMLEDSEEDAELIVHILQKEKLCFLHQRVETKNEFSQAIETFTPDIVLSDHGLPGFTSLDALKICLKQQTATPFILVAGALSDELVNSLREGADDYVLKTNLGRLPDAILKAVKKKSNERKSLSQTKWFKSIRRKIMSKLFKPSSKFKMNQAVQHVSGGPLMVVSGFTYNKKNVLQIICNWYDRDQRVTFQREFPEHELKNFDWNNPHAD